MTSLTSLISSKNDDFGFCYNNKILKLLAQRVTLKEEPAQVGGREEAE